MWKSGGGGVVLFTVVAFFRLNKRFSLKAIFA